MYGGDTRVILQPKDKFLRDNFVFNKRKKDILCRTGMGMGMGKDMDMETDRVSDTDTGQGT